MVNGGIKTADQIAEQLAQVDGVMIGREAYHNPWVMTEWDQRFFDASLPAPDRDEVEARMVEYMQREVTAGAMWSQVARHMLGLRNGLPGARRWRQVWSDHRLKGEAPAVVSRLAHEPANTVARAEPDAIVV